MFLLQNTICGYGDDSGNSGTTAACLKRSYLWPSFKIFSLRQSMRLEYGLTYWWQYLESLSTGTLNDDNDTVHLQHVHITNELSALIDFVDVYNNNNNVILCPINATVDATNDSIVLDSPGTSTTYLSIDSCISDDDYDHYPPEFLNTINMGCLPRHRLTLKIGSPIIVLRNLQPPHIINGTRAVVTSLFSDVIEAVKSDNTTIRLTRVTLLPTDTNNTILFRRKQFPIKLCHSMTINRSQGQDFNRVGIDLRNDCFAHGQLIVSLSRTRRPTDIMVLLPENSNNRTSNPVYQECLL